MPNDAEYALANIPLRWMIQEIKHTNTHIRFNLDKFAQWNIPITIGEGLDRSVARDQGGAAGEDVDVQDAVQPIIDPLSKTRLWWILENVPTSHPFKDMQGRWKTIWR